MKQLSMTVEGSIERAHMAYEGHESQVPPPGVGWSLETSKRDHILNIHEAIWSRQARGVKTTLHD